MKLAPIIVFAFNRLVPLKKCIETLLANEESKFSDLYVFVDGARVNKDGEYDKVKCVQEYVKKITGFKSLTYEFSDTNKGLADSIISGVSKIINEYGDAIILEDDLEFSTGFLRYMNDALIQYKSAHNIFSISGHSLKISIPSDYLYNTYLHTRSDSWGWATWKDRWNSVDWRLDDWNEVKKNKKAFKKWAGSDVYKMINDWHRGGVNSWAIRFCYSQFIQERYSVFPFKSKVINNGFLFDGTNCRGYNRYKIVLDENNEPDIFVPENVINKKIINRVLYYDSIIMRIKSRFLSLLLR